MFPTQRLIDKCTGVALASPGIGKNRKIKLGAIIYDGPTILSAAHNCYKTHPYLARYTGFPCLHAESNSILRLGLDNCCDKFLLVLRVLNDGSLTMAKPCHVCYTIAKEVEIKNIYYSDWKGSIQCLN